MIDSKKSTELSKLTQCGKTATSLGPGSTLGEKGGKKMVWVKKKNLASEGSRAVVWEWERVGEPGDMP